MQTVLIALLEVSDALAVREHLTRQGELLEQQVAAGEQRREMAQLRCESGTANDLEATTADEDLLPRPTTCPTSADDVPTSADDVPNHRRRRAGPPPTTCRTSAGDVPDHRRRRARPPPTTCRATRTTCRTNADDVRTNADDVPTTVDTVPAHARGRARDRPAHPHPATTRVGCRPDALARSRRSCAAGAGCGARRPGRNPLLEK